MSALSKFTRSLTVHTPAGEHTFRDVDCEVTDGVLVVSRGDWVMAWFAAGQWTEASFL